MKRVVAVGGGTGMPILIKSLLTLGVAMDAIVTVADDGGSSGRLRQAFDGFPPGDSRNCLVAMADSSDTMSRLFQYRFPGGEGLESHALGNLIISALVDITGDFAGALSIAGKLVGAKGRVLPPSLEPLTLYADLSPSGRVVGQCNVANRLRPLKSIGITPADAPASPEAVAALGSADLIVLGPGSLFTSIIANLLVKGIASAIRGSAAKKLFLCNLTIQPGETDGFTAADHVRALADLLGPRGCDLVVTSDTALSPSRLSELEAAKSPPVSIDAKELSRSGVEHRAADLTDEHSPTRHDAKKLADFWRRELE
jgi:uncharacterized cofD-like protein